MKRVTTYEHVIRNGRPVLVRSPRGSLDEPMTIRQNMIGVIAGRALSRLLGQR